MDKHPFLFKSGEWLGTGTISFSQSPDTLRYHTHWKVAEEADGAIKLRQIVEIEGTGEQVLNEYNLTPTTNSRFMMELRNDLIGEVSGKGLVDSKVLSWEFIGDDQEFEGFEVYERAGEDEYTMRGEFSSDDDSRTVIEGKIWLKVAQGGNS